jgi:hypothetical protein
LGVVTLIPALAVIVLAIIAMIKLFAKAGQPGWAAVVPFYNTFVMLKIVGRPGWWFVLMLIPIVNIVILVIVFVDLAKAFGKSGGFAALLILLPIVGMPILAFGDAVYRGPVADPGYQQWLLTQPGYGNPQGGYYPQVSAGYPQPGYPVQPGYPQQPGYAPSNYQQQPHGYPQQPGYPAQGYPQHQGYPGQQGHPAQPPYPPPGQPRY